MPRAVADRRKLEGTLVADRGKVEAHARERRLDATVDFILRQAKVVRAKRHVLRHGFGKQLTLGILKHHADLGLNRGGVFLVCQVEPQRVNGTLLGANQTVEMLDQRRLTRTGMTC